MNFVNFDLKNLKGEVFGGLTSTVVGLPVALAFGVASGLGALAGLYGAIAVGFFAAFFGGTRSQIPGPTGPMAIVMSAVVGTWVLRFSKPMCMPVRVKRRWHGAGLRLPPETPVPFRSAPMCPMAGHRRTGASRLTCAS